MTMTEIDRWRQALTLLHGAKRECRNKALRRQMEANIASYRTIVEDALMEWWEQGCKEKDPPKSAS